MYTIFKTKLKNSVSWNNYFKNTNQTIINKKMILSGAKLSSTEFSENILCCWLNEPLNFVEKKKWLFLPIGILKNSLKNSITRLYSFTTDTELIRSNATIHSVQKNSFTKRIPSTYIILFNINNKNCHRFSSHNFRLKSWKKKPLWIYKLSKGKKFYHSKP